jgi:hypothetical protein
MVLQESENVVYNFVKTLKHGKRPSSIFNLSVLNQQQQSYIRDSFQSVSESTVGRCIRRLYCSLVYVTLHYVVSRLSGLLTLKPCYQGMLASSACLLAAVFNRNWCA